jgi:hypothetical protein
VARKLLSTSPKAPIQLPEDWDRVALKGLFLNGLKNSQPYRKLNLEDQRILMEHLPELPPSKEIRQICGPLPDPWDIAPVLGEISQKHKLDPMELYSFLFGAYPAMDHFWAACFQHIRKGITPSRVKRLEAIAWRTGHNPDSSVATKISAKEDEKRLKTLREALDHFLEIAKPLLRKSKDPSIRDLQVRTAKWLIGKGVSETKAWKYTVRLLRTWLPRQCTNLRESTVRLAVTNSKSS